MHYTREAGRLSIFTEVRLHPQGSVWLGGPRGVPSSTASTTTTTQTHRCVSVLLRNHTHNAAQRGQQGNRVCHMENVS